MNLAFEITNKLLDAGYIIEDLAPIKVQILVGGILKKDPRLRATIIHFQDERYAGRMAICHQVGDSLVIADDPAIVTCRRCLGRFAIMRGSSDLS